MIEIKNDRGKMSLRDTLFWDIDLAKINANSSRILIVERILTRGNMTEFKQLIRFYSLPELKQIVVSIGYIDGRSLNFIAGYLNIPKQDFLCFRKKQSNPVHCNF